MIKEIDLSKLRLSGSRIYHVLGFLILGLIVAFCCFYLFSGYPALVRWYLALNACFYHSDQWSANFFTPRIKSDGNMYCLIAIAISFLGIICLFRETRVKSRNNDRLVAKINFTDLGMILLIASFSFSLWKWGTSMSRPAFDEVFSARNVAAIHPFQAISYYMLPNNHLLFNAINSLFFRSFPDQVATGRFISLIAYALTNIIIFFWFKGLTQSRWLSILVSIVLSLQFQVWGFGFQARGYELYLLAGWGMVISLFSWLKSSSSVWLYLNVISIATGYVCMPSFLYLHAAQVLFILFYMIFFKEKQLIFWKFQAAGVFLSFVFYLPALCFSGLDSLVHNGWVAPMTNFANVWAFSKWMFPEFGNYVSHIYSDLHWNNNALDITLFFLPLCLLFSKRKLFKLFALFYMSVWITFLVIVLFMKRLPFERNLISQYSISLAGIILVGIWIADWFSVGIARKLSRAILSLVLVGISLYFIRTNPVYLKNMLYEYDTNSYYEEISAGLNHIPPGSEVAISDEGFYAGYILGKHGCKIIKCPSGNEMYFVKHAGEPMSAALQAKYQLVESNSFYEIYKRQ